MNLINFENGVLSIILTCFLFISCEGVGDKNSSESSTDQSEVLTDTILIEEEVAPTPPQIDSFHTAMAKLIAGIDRSYFVGRVPIDDAYWNSLSSGINASFESILVDRLNPMTEWMSDAFSNQYSDTSLLFYPFSGADFLHAYHLFPNANEYLMMAMEGIGDLPDIYSLSEPELETFLDGIQFSLRDIYRRSYFITGNMEQDIWSKSIIDGLLPVFYWFIARTGHDIVSVGKIGVDSSGQKIVAEELEAYNGEMISGVEFSIVKSGDTQVKRLTYLDCDISNNGFEENPGFKKYVDKIRPCNTFVKSASYLMHYLSFSEIRESVIEHSNLLLEDDTGIPIKYMDDTVWNINLFGAYTKPVRDFSENLFQPDLQKAYIDSSLYKGPLPFSLGYHWGDDFQNQMVFIK